MPEKGNGPIRVGCADSIAADISDLKKQMKKGFTSGTRTVKVHLDGYDLTGLLKEATEATPRDALYCFDQGGNLNAIRWISHVTLGNVLAEG